MATIKRKSVLGAALRDLRLASRKSSADVEQLLGCSQAKVSRIEKGRVGVKRAELEAMLTLYGATEEQRSAMLEKWREANVPSQTVESVTSIPPKLRGLVRLQAEATVIRYVQPVVIPGLLQTGDYVRALAEADEFVKLEDVEQVVAIRKRRQELLLRPNPPQIRAVVSEGVLRDVIGGPAVMIGQLQHLLDLISHHGVELQVRPHTAGALGTMSGAVTVLEFSDPEDSPSVYLEHPAGGEWVEEPASVVKFMRVFDSASRTSLSASGTAEWISARIAELKTM